MSAQVPLYLIAGFLGSGKTSLLNSILEQGIWKRVGVILNDFGSLNIDNTLIKGDDEIVSTELSGGQIFCSCLSGSFVEAVARYADLPIDVLLVEASGLAKPNPLLEIIEWADKKSEHAFDYRGMICVIDAQRYPILSQAVNAVKEQVVFSDLFIVNKCDLSDEQELQQIDRELQLLRPGAPVFHTSYGHVPPDLLRQLHTDADLFRGIDPKEYAGWGAAGRPVPMHIRPQDAVASAKLHAVLKRISPEAFRVKGYVSTVEDGLVLVNCVGEQISVHHELSPQQQKQQPGLVVIVENTSRLKLLLGTLWRETTGTDAVVTTG
ncbi:MAG: CobW family GTP-binding protein [Spirochaetota bacterium]